MTIPSNIITIKDFLDVNDISIKESIRRLDNIIRSMMEDTKECINGKEIYHKIYHRDNNVNRLRVLIFKLLKKSNLQPGILKEYEDENMNPLDLWFLTFNLELTAGELKRIARNSVKSKIDKKDRQKITKIYNEIEKNYLDVMKSYYKKDKELAHKVSSNKYEIVNNCRKLEKEGNNKYVILITEKM